MDNVKQIISANIVALRKKNQLTQIELSKKINYSDKAISRWENGEVVPDVETLNSLSKVFNVSITYFFEEHIDLDVKLTKPTNIQLLTYFSVIAIIWTILTVVFVYFTEFKNRVVWQIFIWGIPLSFSSMLFFFRKTKMRITKFVMKSLLCWTLIASIYLSTIHKNLWLIFLIGIPVQFFIILSSLKTKNDV